MARRLTCQQHAATRCNMLQHAATRCNTLQHAATRCNTLQHTGHELEEVAAHLRLDVQLDKGIYDVAYCLHVELIGVDLHTHTRHVSWQVDAGEGV